MFESDSTSDSECQLESTLRFFLVKEVSDLGWGSLTPIVFLYLVERALILPLLSKQNFCVAKSWFIEFVLCVPYANPGTGLIGSSSAEEEDFVRIIFGVVMEILRNRKDATTRWFRRYGMKYNEVAVLRLVKILFVLSINYSYLRMQNLSLDLPKDFNDAFQSGPSLSAVALAFKTANDPLLIVVLDGNISGFSCSDAVLLNMGSYSSKTEVMEALFPRGTEASHDQPITDERDAAKPSSINWDLIDVKNLDLLLTKQVEVQDHLKLITSVITGLSEQRSHSGDDKDFPYDVNCLIENLNELSSLISSREHGPDVMTAISELLKGLEARRSEIDELVRLAMEKNGPNAVAASGQNDDEKSYVQTNKGKPKSGKGKRGIEEFVCRVIWMRKTGKHGSFVQFGMKSKMRELDMKENYNGRILVF